MQWKQIMKNLIAGSWNTRMKNICVTEKKYGGEIRCCHSDSNDIFDADVFHGQFESSISGALDCFLVLQFLPI